ncbi:MAG: UDP-N-acetylmuramate dehydrogenase [Clostridia bacterium]|nr:UDP-N-acetylmuramate dehydrogenase [Clostridia bacterium]
MFENFDVREEASLKDYSTIKIGGKAKWLVFPRNYLELKKILEIAETGNLKYFILGNGSNTLFDDDGFDGVVISLKKFNKVKVVGDYVYAGAGINLFALNQKLKAQGLSGLEFCYGIPASLGGFVYMNGGCFGHEIGQVVEEVLVLNDGKLVRLKKEEIEFSYRKTNLQDCVILRVKLRLTPQDVKVIEENMNFYFNKKREAQPCDLPSLGSVFKAVYGEKTVYVSKMIDTLGLKGVKIGGAEISKKHAGFIVNTGNATSQDVKDLIELVKRELTKVDVFPELEIIMLEK